VTSNLYPGSLYLWADALTEIADLVRVIQTAEGPCADVPSCKVCPACVPDEGCFYTLLREAAEDLCRKIAPPVGPAPDRRKPKPIIVAGEEER